MGIARRGGNFGVVTSFEFTLHEVGPTVLGGVAFYPGDRTAEVVAAWRDTVSGASDELTSLANLTTAPPVPFLPEETHGTKVVAILGLLAGGAEDGKAALTSVGSRHAYCQPARSDTVRRAAATRGPAVGGRCGQLLHLGHDGPPAR